MPNLFQPCEDGNITEKFKKDTIANSVVNATLPVPQSCADYSKGKSSGLCPLQSGFACGNGGYFSPQCGSVIAV
jgi:hypothetical protein